MAVALARSVTLWFFGVAFVLASRGYASPVVRVLLYAWLNILRDYRLHRLLLFLLRF